MACKLLQLGMLLSYPCLFLLCTLFNWGGSMRFSAARSSEKNQAICKKRRQNGWCVGVSLPSASTVEDIGLALIGSSKRGSLKIRNRCYIAHFGMKPGLVAVIWKELVQSGWIKLLHVRPPKPEHLLWSLLFLNNYSVEDSHSRCVQCCETTFRKWA
jgi:hypothetical protein